METKFFIIMAMLINLSSGCRANGSAHDPLLSMDESAPKNYYTVSFSSSGCNFRILINDISAVDFFDSGAISGMVPINMAILKSGTQRLKVQLYPVEGHEEKGINSTRPLDIFIKCKEKGQGLSDYETVLSNPLGEVEIPVGAPYFEYECTFEAEVPYVLQGWSNCKDLREEPDLEEQVIKKLNDLKLLFEKKKYDEITELMLYKQNSGSYAHYCPIDEGLKEMAEMFDEMRDEFDKVADIENYRIVFMGDGKLVYVENVIDRESALRLEKDGSWWPILVRLGKREGSDELEVIY